MRQVLVLLAVVAFVAVIVACSAPPTPTPVTTATAQPSPTAVPTKIPPTATATVLPPLSLDALKNAEYIIEGPAAGKAKLSNGTYKEPIAKSSASVTVQINDVSAIGDLNGDSVQDTAVILSANTGGSGVFYYLYGVLNDKGTPKPSAPEFLGDRIKLKALAIQGSEITVEFLTQGPKDSMANPTLAATRKYKLQDSKLVSLTPATPTLAASPTKSAPAATAKPAVTATPTKPPMPKGSIAYHWNDQGIDRLSIVNVESGTVTPFVVTGPVMDLQINTNARVGEWSPDGSKFAYIFAGAPGASNILKVMSGDTTLDLYSSDSTGGLSSPTWSPDSKRVAFIRLGGDKQAWSLIIVNADGTKCTEDKFECLIKRAEAEQYRGGLAWSKQNVFALGFNTTGANDVHTLLTDGGTVRNLTNNPADDGSPAWSPDGKQIAFTSTRDGKPQIYVMNADGSGAHRVSDNQFADFSPTWSPDGRWIAFASTRNGATNIYMMDVSGRNLTPITKSGGDHPVWSR